LWFYFLQGSVNLFPEVKAILTIPAFAIPIPTCKIIPTCCKIDLKVKERKSGYKEKRSQF
jgi:hypothetical protein